MIELNEDQKRILNNVLNRLRSRDKRIIKVAGYAGTGKTMLMTQIAKELYPRKVALVSLTGKASSVLFERLKQDADFNFDNLFVGTIHRLLYIPETSYDETLKRVVIVGWKKVDYLPFKIVLVDEASMVPSEIWDDLLSFDVQVVAFGDPAQLPPVTDQSPDFNIFENYDFFLSEVVRKTPLLKLSMFVRKYGYIPFGVYDQGVAKIKNEKGVLDKLFQKIDFRNLNAIMLTATNKSRSMINSYFRASCGYHEKLPYLGEKVVCLKNNYDYNVLNGQIFSVLWLLPREDHYQVTLENQDGELQELPMTDYCFGQEKYDLYPKGKEKFLCMFDYGYALSVHKSQGSEWDMVVLFEERVPFWSKEYYRRWLYTAITRSTKSLIVIA